MATITKIVDQRIDGMKRYQYWASTENADDGTAIATGDIFKIEESLGHPAKYVYIETDVNTVLSVRFNSQFQVIPLRDARLNPLQPPALDGATTVTDSTQAAIVINANETWELDHVFPVSDIQIVSFTAGSFELIVA